MPAEPPIKPHQARRTLEKIAAALGIAPEVLTAGSAPPRRIAQTQELLDLWSALQTDESREQVLRLLRELNR